jgi:hypothetical protein
MPLMKGLESRVHTGAVPGVKTDIVQEAYKRGADPVYSLHLRDIYSTSHSVP